MQLSEAIMEEMGLCAEDKKPKAKANFTPEWLLCCICRSCSWTDWRQEAQLGKLYNNLDQASCYLDEEHGSGVGEVLRG